ncbi:hypothetical protein BSKO_00928 [Bryopsis sp. KO-2023]|nr:hypothetical protein BSKO_00928 [Bryopsis sp. KO-2023]
MSLQFSLVGHQIKYFRVVLLSLSKTGASELLIEAFPDKLILRSINSSRSAYLAVSLGFAFFDEFQVQGSVVQAAVLLKHALVVFGSARVVRVSFQVAGVDDKLTARLFCENGLRKVYGISLLETEVLNANVDESQYPVTMVAWARDLQGLLASFQSDQDELTIIAHPGGSTSSGSCELRTFHDPAISRKAASTLRTEVSFNSQSLFSEYEHTAQDSIDATFNVHDLKAVVYLFWQVGADVSIKMHSPGTPLVVQPRWPASRSRRDMNLDMELDAKMVLATLAGSQISQPTASRAGQQIPQGTASGHGGQSQFPVSSVPSPLARSSEGTVGASNQAPHANPSRGVWCSSDQNGSQNMLQRGSTGAGSGLFQNWGGSSGDRLGNSADQFNHDGRNTDVQTAPRTSHSPHTSGRSSLEL